MWFQNPEKPIATCAAATCTDCPLTDRVHCHFSLRDLLYFLTICLPGFLLGGAGIINDNAWLLVPWIAIIIGYFGFVEIRVMCAHCPHYAEDGKTLRCWANHGSPKLWTYRPGPMNRIEKLVFFAGFVLVWGFPLISLLAGRQWFLTTVYLLTSTGFFATLKQFLCTQCINFACPLNGVPQDVRQQFFDRNPCVGSAWKTTGAQPLGSASNRYDRNTERNMPT
jgi:hypothetical protein